MPINLRELTGRYGKASLLTDSPDVWRRVRSTENEVVRDVVTILNEMGKGLEQEALLVHGRAEMPGARKEFRADRIRSGPWEQLPKILLPGGYPVPPPSLAKDCPAAAGPVLTERPRGRGQTRP